MRPSYCFCEGSHHWDIQSLVDNELDDEQEKRIRKYIANNPPARACYEELLKQKELLKKWWKAKNCF